jgi:hypothetical protein
MHIELKLTRVACQLNLLEKKGIIKLAESAQNE